MTSWATVRKWAILAGAVALVPFATTLEATSAAGAAAAPSGTVSPAVRSIQAAAQLPRGASSLGPVAPTDTVSGEVVLRPRDNGAVQAFISEVSNRTSPEYHHYLASGAFASRFGPLPSTISAVESQLQAEGLQVTGAASDGMFIGFTGPASKVESAFHTGLSRFRLSDGTTGQATTSSVELPTSISGAVSAVVGLNNLVKAQPGAVRHGSAADGAGRPSAAKGAITPVAGAPAACANATAAATTFGGLSDDQIANAYGAFGLYLAHDTAGGQHIAVYELEPFLPSDLQTFDTCYFGGAAATQMGSRLKVIPVDGGQPAGPGSGESILDVEDVSAMAPGANVDVYEAPNNSLGVIEEYASIINNDVDQVVTTSWGLCETAIQQGEPGQQQAENLLFEQAAAQGQSVFAAAGDVGSDDCNAFRTSQPVSPVLSVDDPGSQRYVVSVGGTTIDAATRPPSEHVWNDGADWGAAGGGISESWAMPTWQLEAKVPGVKNSDTIGAAEAVEAADSGNPNFAFCQSAAPGGLSETACREVPDVSAQADEFTGAVTIYSSLFGSGGAGWITIGGTSSATPIWAALLALINASNTSAACTVPGRGVGFVSPLLYSVASDPTEYHQSFNDITQGNNDPYGFSDLYPATQGFDMASGLGSPELTSPPTSTNQMPGPGLAFNLCHAAVSTSRPVVGGLSPGVVPSGGGVTVTISGSGYAPGGVPDVADVQIGSYQLPAGAFTVQDDATITATVPASSLLRPPADPTDGAGGYQVVVTLQTGESSLPGPASLLEYVDQTSGNTVPAVTGIRSYAGSGGTSVDIFGTGFGGSSSPNPPPNPPAQAVTFGGAAATSFVVVSDSEIQAVVPALGSGTTCAQDGSFFNTGETAANDICQVHVVVTNVNGPSSESTILPLYEGALSADANGVMPAPPGEEIAPQPDEFDYLPAPTITSISTSGGPASLASEFGGSTITINGTGFNLVGLDFVAFGDPGLESSEDFDWLSVTGTQIVLFAPGTPALTSGPTNVPVSVTTAAGRSAALFAQYAGLPTVTGVVATSGPTAVKTTAQGLPGGPDTGGTSIAVSGADFSQAIGVIFVDTLTPFSIGTQFRFSVANDEALDTQTVPQNPATVDVEVCTVTACSFSPPADEFILFPPGSPDATSAAPASGPATGGTAVVISGANLGCVAGVSFGSQSAKSFANPLTPLSNPPGLLDCGQTSAVDAVAPPLPAGTALPRTVPVTVTTDESVLAGDSPVTAATFTYEPVHPVLTADQPPRTGTAGVAYGPYTFKASGDPAPTFSVTSGVLPPGLALNRTTGVLSGKPTKLGIYTFRVTAANGAAPAAVSPSIAITIRAAPVFTADTPPAFDRAGVATSYTFKATGLPAPTFSVSAGALPPGLTLNRSTGLLAGHPARKGIFAYRVTANNGVAPRALTPIRIVIVR
jgi:Pro-kumamolisin, activation domain/Putative Ig domain/IPT/TIG domain